jgi:hypothetical protein
MTGADEAGDTVTGADQRCNESVSRGRGTGVSGPGLRSSRSTPATRTSSGSRHLPASAHGERLGDWRRPGEIVTNRRNALNSPRSSWYNPVQGADTARTAPIPVHRERAHRPRRDHHAGQGLPGNRRPSRPPCRTRTDISSAVCDMSEEPSILAAYVCGACEIQGRDLEVSPGLVLCWNCGDPAVITARVAD